MTLTFKALSILLSYPSSEFAAAGPELTRAIESEGLVPRRLRRDLLRLIDELAGDDLFDLQERYGLLFDRTRSLSLHLFEHIHGESRDRGQAMVDLQALYERHGLRVEARELPDYLPLFLEFLSTRPTDEARTLLAEPAHILRALAERLHKRKSAYAVAFYVLEALAREKASPELLEQLLNEAEDDPQDLEALDRVWAEAEVGFGPAAGCGTTSPPAAVPERGVPVTIHPPMNRAAV